MVNYKELRQILNGSGMSIAKYNNGKTVVKDSNVFKGAKLSAVEEAQALVEKAIKEDTVSYSKKLGITQLDSLKDVNDRAVRAVGGIIDCLGAKKKVTAQELREQMTTATVNSSFIILYHPLKAQALLILCRRTLCTAILQAEWKRLL